MSEITNSAVIKVEIDAGGVEVGLRKIDEGAAKTGKSLENLGRGDGLSKLGDGAQAASNKFSAGTKGIVDAIERRTSAMELGKRGTAEYYAALANQKGINPAVLKPYLDQLDAVTRKTQEAAAAQQRADDGSKFVEGLRARAAEIGKSAAELAAMRAEQLGVADAAAPLIARLREAEEAAGGLGGALGITTEALVSFLASLAGAVSIGGLVATVSTAVDSLASLDDMAQKTGSSVETLSRLQKVAQATGQDFGTVDGAISKLAKGMGGLDEDSNKVLSALSRLGVSAKDAAGNLRDPSQVLVEASKNLQNYDDGARKTALVNDLLGKSGADLLPYLNDVSELFGKFSSNSTASSQQASAFGNNLGVMQVRLGEVGAVIATNLLPYLLKFSEYVKGIAESEKFKEFMVDTGKAVSDFAKFVADAYTVVVPAAKIAAAYFAIFVGVPAIVGAATTFLAAFYGVVGTGITRVIASGGAIAGLNTALFGTTIAATAASGAMGKLQIAGGLLFAAFAGWEIGKYLYDNFAVARIAGARFVEAMLIGFENLKFHLTSDFNTISSTWNGTLGQMKVNFAGYVDAVAGGLSKIGAGPIAEGVSKYAESLRTAGTNQVALATKTVAGNVAMARAHEATLKSIRENIQGMVDYESATIDAEQAVAGASKSGGKGKGGPKGAAEGDTSAVKKMKEAYDSLTLSIREKIAAAQMEANGQGSLAESQKLQIALDQQLASGKLKLSAADLARYQASIGQLAAQEEIIASNKRALAGGIEFAKMQKDLDDQAAKRLDGLTKEADQNEELARTFGRTKTEIQELTIARLEDQLAQRASNALTLKEIDDLEAEITARKRNRDALRSIETQDSAKKANDAMVDSWTKTVDKYSDVFRTGFADMLNKGKDGWKSFTTSLVTTFKTSVADQIYKMFAQPFVVRMVASLVGMTGGGVAQAAGVGGDLGSVTGIVSAAKAAYSAISSGFSGISTAVADGVQGAMYQAGLTKQIASNGSFATGAGTVAGYAGGAAAGVFAGRAISGGFSLNGGSGNSTVNVGTIAGAILGGPIGAAIGGVLGGVANRLFGRKAKEFGDTVLNGSFGAGGFSGSSDTAFVQKGGLFRSDKRGVDRVGVDAGTAAAFSAGYETIKAASADFAETLGINATALQNRAQSLSIKLGKDQAENEKAVAEFFTGVGNRIALELVPRLAAFSKQGEAASATLQRIAENYAFVDVALDAFGKSFGAVGVESVAARERLVDLVGGLEALGKGTAFFAQNFLTEAERLEPIAAKVKISLADMGLAFVDTRDEFKSIVRGLDLTTASGATTYAGLMKIQEAFAQIYPAAEAASNALSERIELQKEYDDLTLTAAQQLSKQRAALDPSNRALFDQVQGVKALKVAQDAARASLGDVISRLRSFGESARELGKGLLLGDLSTLTPEQQYSEARRQYESTLVAAKGGDAGAQDRFTSIATSFLEASQRINGGDSMYAADFDGVIKTSDEIAKWSVNQVDVAQASLDALNAQVAALGKLNATMTVVADGVLGGGTGALVPPPPRPFSDGPSFNMMGTPNMSPLIDEVKMLRAELTTLRTEVAGHTSNQILANARVTIEAARLGAEELDTSMNNRNWRNRHGKVALE